MLGNIIIKMYSKPGFGSIDLHLFECKIKYIPSLPRTPQVILSLHEVNLEPGEAGRC